jgi:endonuclease/exonuclease/phosphatase family metal-dependent hydrolase
MTALPKTSMLLRRMWLVLSLLTFSAVLAAAPAQAATPTMKVMSRNLCFGADLSPAAQATNLNELMTTDASIFTAVHATDFPARAKVLAREIKDADPDLLGVQELALWRQGPVGVLDGPATPSTEVVYDFLASLQSELAAIGAPYSVVRVRQGADIEIPAGAPYNRDIRLTLRAGILAKASPPAEEFKVQSTNSATFSNNLTLTTVAGPVRFGSGWESANVTVHRHTFRFVNTHLEPISNFYRTAQSQELLAGPLNTSGPVVLVGDLNSDPDDPVFNESGSPFNQTNPYDKLTGAGLADAWVQANGEAAGPTCCYAANLLDPTPMLTRRIDHVLTKANVGRATRDRVVGTDADNKTPSGLWPSDHAGVVATLNP